jgi:hypothetical protein
MRITIGDRRFCLVAKVTFMTKKIVVTGANVVAGNRRARNNISIARASHVTAMAALVMLSGCLANEPMRTGKAVAIPGAMPGEQWSAAFYLADPVKFTRSAHIKDCNDYAAENSARLRAEGLTPHFVMAITESGVGHMVVAVEQNSRTLIYDNRLPRPEEPIDWRMLPYRWIAREGDDGLWYAARTGADAFEASLPFNPGQIRAPL